MNIQMSTARSQVGQKPKHAINSSLGTRPTLQVIPDGSGYSMLSSLGGGSPTAQTRKISLGLGGGGTGKNPETPKSAAYYLQQSKKTAATLSNKYLTLIGQSSGKN